jgi:phosphinothricin acetyltransferase
MPHAPGGGPVLRPCREDDIATVQAIYAHHVLNGTATFELTPPDTAEIARRWRSVTSAGLPWQVATVGGRVRGYAYAAPFRERPAYRFTLEDSVYIAPDALCAGIGRALLAEMIAHTTAAGHRQMLALIGDSGNAASIALHARLGFRHAGTLRSVGFKFGRWLDVVLMQRPLGGGDEGLPDQAAESHVSGPNTS